MNNNSFNSHEYGSGYVLSLKSQTTALDADRPPVFVSKLQLTSPLQEHKPCRLESKISAQPPPTVSWYKDGKSIRNKPRYKTSFVKDIASLDIQEVLPEDAGVYECVASNPAGTTKSSVELMVPGNYSLFFFTLILYFDFFIKFLDFLLNFWVKVYLLCLISDLNTDYLTRTKLINSPTFTEENFDLKGA